MEAMTTSVQGVTTTTTIHSDGTNLGPASSATMVQKRNGEVEPLDTQKIRQRIANLIGSREYNDSLRDWDICGRYSVGSGNVDADVLARDVIDSLPHGVVKSSEIDVLIAETSAYRSIEHPDYMLLGGRVMVTSLQHATKGRTFTETMRLLYRNDCDSMSEPSDAYARRHIPLVSEAIMRVASDADRAARIDAVIDATRDTIFDYFAYRTLVRSYLIRTRDGLISETPQHMWMRVALGIHLDSSDSGDDDDDAIGRAIETYELLSHGVFTHASPTLFNAGTPVPQMSSCFLVTLSDDSVAGIFKTVSDCAVISKNAGGIGINMHSLRGSGRPIAGTGGTTKGLVPALRLFNETAVYADQGAGKRRGAFAIYVEPWHVDIYGFLDMCKSHGTEELRCRDLFNGLWIPDLFMRRVRDRAEWSLFSEDSAPGLSDLHGDEFNRLYERYEREGRACKTVDAKHLWDAIVRAQIETGMPYMLYKDTVNALSNQKNVGTIRSSNLCVRGDTLIMTDRGYYRIDRLAAMGAHVNVWNGENWSSVLPRQTARDARLLEVSLTDGTTLHCTPEHRFFVNTKRGRAPVEIAAKDLRANMSLIKCKFPHGGVPYFDVDEDLVFRDCAYTHGAFCGRGSYSSNLPRFTVSGERCNMIPYLLLRSEPRRIQGGNGFLCLLTRDMPDRGAVPVNCSRDTKLRWLAGLLDSNGIMTTRNNGRYLTISIRSKDRRFMEKLKLMLQTLGCSSIKYVPETRRTPPPPSDDSDDTVPGSPASDDGRGPTVPPIVSRYTTYRMHLGSAHIIYLYGMGLCTHRIKYATGDITPVPIPARNVSDESDNGGIHCDNSDSVVQYDDGGDDGSNIARVPASVDTDMGYYSTSSGDDSQYSSCNGAAVGVNAPLSSLVDDIPAIRDRMKNVSVTSVEDMGEIADTYCFTEKERGMGVFNGILTGQCAEIVEYTSPEETAVCNLASVSLPSFVTTSAAGCGGDGGYRFDHERLRRTVGVVVRNLNRIIDRTFYPTPETRRSNMRHRPMGIGVQGMADVFAIMGLDFDSREAIALNAEIFETMYYAALEMSCDLAQTEGGPYDTFAGSPLSRGMFQFDLYDDMMQTRHRERRGDKRAPPAPTRLSGRWNWDALRQRIVEHGVRNSLLIAVMPTASTSQLLRNNECTEPFTDNYYVRNVLSGTFPVMNVHLVRDLAALGLWDERVREGIKRGRGSVRGIEGIPDSVKSRYRTAWELQQRTILDHAIARAPFVDQSQSMNVFFAQPNPERLSRMHRYGWARGLKTGMYYLRMRPAAEALQFTVDSVPAAVTATAPHSVDQRPTVCSRVRRPSSGSANGNGDDDDECLACGA